MSVDKVLAACQDRKRDGDVLFGRGRFEDAAAVYCDADALLQLPDADSGYLQCSWHLPIHELSCIFMHMLAV